MCRAVQRQQGVPRTAPVGGVTPPDISTMIDMMAVVDMGGQLRKMTLRAAAATGAIAGMLLSVGLASPAHAAMSQCTQVGEMCGWTGANYTGTKFYWQITGGTGWTIGECHTGPAPYGRAIWNRGLINFQFYSGTNCTGSTRVAAAHASIADLGFTEHSFKALGI